MSAAKYKRIVIKISGEALAGDERFGIDGDTLKHIAGEIAEVRALGVEIALVVGGGNFWRGRSAKEMDRPTADYIGMLATVMNCLALQSAIENVDVPTRLQSAINMLGVAEPYARRKAISHLAKGYVVIFGAGTGNPFYSTDTTAALRAAEIGADVILFAKNVDAVYSGDPATTPDVERYSTLTFKEVLDKGLGFMDSTAATFCMEYNIPIQVFGLREPGGVIKAVKGERIGTIIR
ncbi:MAG: UMP kinase [Clostridiales Family XIII bacterium]|nr:UMP kinase [Clostridiales Family XIII bacterium]